MRATAPDGFCHEALLYRGEAGFLAGTVPFLRDGLEGDEPMLVVVGAPKISALRAELGRGADRIHFADMAEVGHNPARIIPAWRDFLDGNGGGSRPVRGIGEPIWAGRGPAELVECQRHETLLNVAFAGSGTWSLLCPYDVDALDAAVIDEAQRSHPYIVEGGARHSSGTCRDLDTMAAPFDVELPPPPADAPPFAFRGPASLTGLRTLVAQRAVNAGLDRRRAAELVLAVNEAASNSIRHADGEGTLRMWNDHDVLICELRDRGCIDAPLVGRERPSETQCGGRGLWMANQLCDLVQMRTSASGNIVRMHMRRNDCH
jgi:anti-sigma regulatory factor (Ser/Thr protein kinase)